ncbi:MAG: 3-phosphoshikimate 1-carboxyvinyltransferase [Eubacterium sp.]|nr:3-phosphoshikimate 1-carboxyvinyltransferase [Eubacterium sp.]
MNSIVLRTYKYHFEGTIRAIASKSHAHRLIIAASLADIPTRIYINTTSKDIEATISCMEALGAVFAPFDGGYDVTPIAADRAGNKVKKSSAEPADSKEMTSSTEPVGSIYSIDCGESGSTLRFLLPILGILGLSTSITMHGRLSERPLSPLYEEMLRHGATMSPVGTNPFFIKDAMTGGIYNIAGNVSSQYITGLLLALPLAKEDSEIRIVGKLESRPYVNITLSVLDMFGIAYEEIQSNESLTSGKSDSDIEISTVYRIKGNQTYHSPSECTVSGDWSNSAFFLSAGAISKDGVTVTGLDLNSPQGDKAIIDLLRRFGADISISHNPASADSGSLDLTKNALTELSSITVKGGSLHGIDIDAADIPDLVPILSAVAATAEGTTIIRNIERLRIKESDRVKTVIETLTNLGATISESKDEDGNAILLIEGSRTLPGGIVDSYNDHRIAMTAAVLSIACSGPVTIFDPLAVNKSYPTFYEDFDKACH